MVTSMLLPRLVMIATGYSIVIFTLFPWFMSLLMPFPTNVLSIGIRSQHIYNARSNHYWQTLTHQSPTLNETEALADGKRINAKGWPTLI